jgi:hypothetical protein
LAAARPLPPGGVRAAAPADLEPIAEQLVDGVVELTAAAREHGNTSVRVARSTSAATAASTSAKRSPGDRTRCLGDHRLMCLQQQRGEHQLPGGNVVARPDDRAQRVALVKDGTAPRARRTEAPFADGDTPLAEWTL